MLPLGAWVQEAPNSLQLWFRWTSVSFPSQRTSSLEEGTQGDGRGPAWQLDVQLLRPSVLRRGRQGGEQPVRGEEFLVEETQVLRRRRVGV